MGYDVSACAAFGVMPREHKEKLGGVYEEFLDSMNGIQEAVGEETGSDIDDARDTLCEGFTPKFIESFKKAGIIIPGHKNMLHYTGTDDERPGRTDTDSYEWILGFGLLTQPWDYPTMDPSFKKVARWFTWVVGG